MGEVLLTKHASLGLEPQNWPGAEPWTYNPALRRGADPAALLVS